MSPRNNEVTLFSNGIGHFRRVYEVKADEQKRISIPFKRDNIGDVAASLQVFGKVKLDAPPSFTPTDANTTQLKIEQSAALLSLLRNLSGAAIAIKSCSEVNPVQGTLLGVDEEKKRSGDAIIRSYFISYMVGSQIKYIPLGNISFVEFLDDSIKTEIDKALKNNFQKIKPDSTLVEIALSSKEDTEATVQYTTPVAAWKMRYAIREDHGKFILEGAAIIDNNTDEDWDNFKVSVVTGHPISFSTDIAAVCVPKRRMIHLVDNQVLSNVDVQEGVMMACAQPANFMRAASLGPKMSTSTANYTQFGAELMVSADGGGGGGGCGGYSYLAEAPGVESKDVGDFCVFTSKELITILARKSAVVPMFVVPLSTAGIVLLYKEVDNARRPYRAIKFKNETEYSLGKGKTVIYNEGVFSGECVLDTTKPGENRMLPHCLENGVKIVKDQSPTQQRRSSIKISEGVSVAEEVMTNVSTYTIENKKDEQFNLALEHINALGSQSNIVVGFDGVEIEEQEKLSDSTGYRLYFKLAPKEKLVLTVTETLVQSTQNVIAGYYPWIQNNIINTKNPLAEDKQIQNCVAIQSQIDELQKDLNCCKTRREELTGQAGRIRDNLAAAKDVGTNDVVAEWVADLNDTEKEIRNIEKHQIPKINDEIKKLQANLKLALTKVSVSWQEKVAK